MAALAEVRLNAGQKASLALHGGLILSVIALDLLQPPQSAPIPEVTEVAIISAQEFAEMTRMPVAPPTPVSPSPQPIAPLAAITPPPPIVAPPPPEAPQAAVVAPVTTPDSSLVPVQRPAERVAPEAAPTPEPEVRIAPVDQAAVSPDATATITAPEAQEATQRAAAATETVTEATRLSETEPAQRTATAPEVSLRPRARPVRAAPTPEPPPPAPVETTPQPEAVERTDPIAGAIENALAEALAGAFEEPSAALSQAEMDQLRLNIESCWNVGLLSTEALAITVTLAFDMTPDARPIPESIRLADASGGSINAQQAAFETGRQAIVQCGITGYGLPVELYDQWRQVEIVFNPARMSSR